MNAIQDTRDDYIPMDDFALERAGVNPYDCDSSVEVAIQKQLPGWERAKAYHEELEGFFYSDTQETDKRIIESEDYGSFGFMIHRDFASEWKPAKKEPENLSEKTTATTTVTREKKPPRSVMKTFGMMLKRGFTHGSLEFPKYDHIDDRGVAADFVSMIQDLRYELGQSDSFLSRPRLYALFNEAMQALDPDNTDR